MKRLIFSAILALAGIVSVFSDINIEGKLTHEVSTEAGKTYSGSIIIQNTGSKPEEVKIYQKDYSSSAGGIHNYTDPGTNPRSNADWITLNPKKFQIQPGDSYTAYFSVAVPADESLVGTYWSILMVESIPEKSPESSSFDPEESSVGVQTILRYGVRIISHIGDTGTITPQITASALNNENGQLKLLLDIKNAGSRLLRINTWAEVYNSEGDFIGKFPGDHLAVFPDSVIQFAVDMSSITAGKYLATLVLDCGGNNVFGVKYNFDIK